MGPAIDHFTARNTNGLHKLCSLGLNKVSFSRTPPNADSPLRELDFLGHS